MSSTRSREQLLTSSLEKGVKEITWKLFGENIYIYKLILKKGISLFLLFFDFSIGIGFDFSLNSENNLYHYSIDEIEGESLFEK